MKIEVGNRIFEIITASDVIRDGIGLELWDMKEDKLLIEIFRNDAKKEIEFFSDTTDLPLSVVEKLIELFDNKIGREFQD